MTGRVFANIGSVADHGPHLTLAALARTTGIPRPMVRPIAEDLVRRRVLFRTSYGYCLGPRLERLGPTAAQHTEYAEARSVLTAGATSCSRPMIRRVLPRLIVRLPVRGAVDSCDLVDHRLNRRNLRRDSQHRDRRRHAQFSLPRVREGKSIAVSPEPTVSLSDMPGDGRGGRR